ncbi:helix-turn-helix transcriptional regulator [Methanothrix sp.]|uniref:helix-turn-helix transcriptional regulator n=1 Tax=Methanothrix sp. TaxID=90426 RepID=UPI0034E280B1
MSDILSVVTASEKRKNLLLLLRNGPRTMDEIRAILNVTTTGMLPQIKILTEHGLVTKERGEYRLTVLGEIISAHLKDLVDTLDVLEREETYWRDHDLSAIPPHLRMRIRELAGYRLISSGEEELYESHHEFLEKIRHSQRVHGFSPVLHPVYPRFFLDLARKGTEITLILTESVYEKCQRQYGEMLEEGMRYENARLQISNEEFRFAFVVTDIFFSLTLFFRDGRFDTKVDLNSLDSNALKWGEDLFTYCLERSRPAARR